jgi:hypothetical protein
MHHQRKISIRALVAVVLGLWVSANLASAASPMSYDWSPWSSQAAYRPDNVLAVQIWPQAVKRVAVLPLTCGLAEVPADYFSAHDPIWRAALQGSHRAEFVSVSRADLLRWIGKSSVSTAEALPPDFLERLSAFTGADAVAFLEVTSFSPYGSISIGFRARITEVRFKSTLWAIEDVIQMDDTSVSQVAKDVLSRRESRSSTASELNGVRLTPSRAIGYVAAAIAQTLPPRKI